MFGLFKKKEPPQESLKRFPPVPDWQPTIVQPLDRISECIRTYTNGLKDFAVFAHGTCVVLEDGLSDEQAIQFAQDVLHNILNAHPDMNPLEIDDGNILIYYNQPAMNVVLVDIALKNWPEIDKQYLQALATDEVLITELGPNRFDDFGKKALFGRCFMFMDAQNPKVIRVERRHKCGE